MVVTGRLCIRQLHLLLALYTVSILSRYCVPVACEGSGGKLLGDDQPPVITKQAEKEIAYKAGEVVELVCEASGSVDFIWTRNGEQLDLPNEQISAVTSRPQHQRTGTIEILSPTSSDDGVYQCFAENSLGKAASVKTLLKEAVLGSFATVLAPLVHRPVIGSSLILNCNPPESYPTPMIYWGTMKPGHSSQVTPFEESDRVTHDYNGNLYFSNVIRADSLSPNGPADDDIRYICSVYNTVIRRFTQGDDQAISPVAKGNLYFSNVEASDGNDTLRYACIVQNARLRTQAHGDDQMILVSPLNKTSSSPGKPKYQAPRLMWSSPKQDVAIIGRRKKMKCIFSGFPTPSVTWKMADGSPLPNTINLTSFNQEMVIEEVSMLHAGLYRCFANNSATNAPASVEFQLIIESPPYWLKNEPPRDVTTMEDESASFDCLVGGKPVPTISWSINAIPLKDLSPEPRRIITATSLKYVNLTMADSQVIQCNASNKHGYILANAYLKIKAEPPTIIVHPATDVKAGVGENLRLTCQAIGAPVPLISWKRESKKPLISDRFYVHPNGELEIKSMTLEDEDVYSCEAINMFGHDIAMSRVSTRTRTRITESIDDVRLNALRDIELPCRVEADERELSRLIVSWRRDERPINYAVAKHIRYNISTHSLHIRMAAVNDSGSYSCSADSSFDSAEITTKLLVVDRPSPPSSVRLETCGSRSAEVSWVAGYHNNEPIIDFTVYYNTSHDPTVREANRTTRHWLKVRLVPWTNYTFHVTARNKLGVSNRSEHTPGFCTTPQTRPEKHPEGVCARTDGEAGQLIITWLPMSPAEQYGERFYYIVRYKRATDNGPMLEKMLYDWRNTELVINDVPPYTAYNVSVLAANTNGLGYLGTLTKHVVYSAEGVPQMVPTGFEVNITSVTAKSAQFQWEPVDDSPQAVQGFFVGYQISYWKTSNPGNVRTERIVLQNKTEDCTTASRAKQKTTRKRQALSVVRGSVTELWPASRVTATVAVLNGVRAGQSSDPIEFATPEGVPDPVEKVSVPERGSHHLLVAWKKPLETNGNLTGYNVGYKRVNSSEVFKQGPYDPSVERAKITGLDPDTDYEVYIWAHTAAGPGNATVIRDYTVALSPLDKPVIDNLETGDNFILVEWKSSEHTPPVNPASTYSITYRRKDKGTGARSHVSDNGGSRTAENDESRAEEGAAENRTTKATPVDEWVAFSVENVWNRANITGLDWGITYEFIVIGFNGAGEQRSSDPREATVGVKNTPIIAQSAGASWFLWLLLIILFLLLLLLILCCLKCGKRGKYPVLEKERLYGYSPDSEPTFGEYTKSGAGPVRSNSLDSDQKPLESETNSLDEYEDTDPNKFNEDGSFIGVYGSPGGPAGIQKMSNNEQENTFASIV